MNEIAKRDDAPKPPVAAKAGGVLAGLVPADLDQAFRLSTALARAGEMVPAHFQGRPEAIMAAIVRGMEIGLAPMQALSSIAVINGRATIWGDALPAMMQRAGHHVDVDYEGEGDRLAAVATLTRGDTGKTIVRRFSIADAKRAGLLDKKGPWQQYPTRMLAMRARSWAIRDGAADALMGLTIADEAQDYGPDAARDVTPAKPRRGGVVMQPVDALPPADRDEIMEAPEPEEMGMPTAEERAAAEAAAMAAFSREPGEDDA